MYDKILFGKKQTFTSKFLPLNLRTYVATLYLLFLLNKGCGRLKCANTPLSQNSKLTNGIWFLRSEDRVVKIFNLLPLSYPKLWVKTVFFSVLIRNLLYEWKMYWKDGFFAFFKVLPHLENFEKKYHIVYRN